MLSLQNILLLLPPPTPPSPRNVVSANDQSVLGNSLDNDDGGSVKLCRDCGNRAKKGCGFGRCRTCCRTRKYDCPTHVKSTWVPAAQRRYEQDATTAAAGGSSSSGCKRPRIEVSDKNMASTSTTCNAHVSLVLQTGSSHQDASFKESLLGKVQAPAVFRRIRVTAITNDEADIVYLATVTISGHVFKGFLYDHGIDENNSFPCISKLHSESHRGRGNSDRPHDPVAAFND